LPSEITENLNRLSRSHDLPTAYRPQAFSLTFDNANPDCVQYMYICIILFKK
jgi:hypothetical protein